MSSNPTLPQPQDPDRLSTPISGFPAEIERYLTEAFQAERVIVYQGEDQSPAGIFHRPDATQWTVGKFDPGTTVDLVVCLNPQPPPGATLARLCQTTSRVLLIWATLQLVDPSRVSEKQDAWLTWFSEQDFYPERIQYPRLDNHHTVLLSKSAQPSIASLAAYYEREIWQLHSENTARRALLAQLRDELSMSGIENAKLIDQLRQANDDLYQEYMEIYTSESWQLMQRLHRIRHRLFPPGSQRERVLGSWLRNFALIRSDGLSPGLKRAYRGISWWLRARIQKKHFQSADYLQSRSFTVPPVEDRPVPDSHTGQIDIIICVHNALADVERCLDSVLTCSNPPYNLILVDDGSQEETRTFLEKFAGQHNCLLLRNEEARGYTRAANQGMRASQGDFVLLLNSDTIVTPGWLDRLTACALSNDRIGVVGPLSNTASWQSIPRIEEGDDWATNSLPAEVTVNEMGALVARGSSRLYPEMKLLNGFCLFIRREVLERVGLFDEDTFGAGYGEEDDFCLRVRAAGWQLALADDVYIYHAQSKSYSTERRRQLYERSGKKLVEKHGQQVIQESVEASLNNPVLQGIRARSQGWIARSDLIASGREQFTGKRVLFLLPIMHAGGGGNVIISEARALRAMGVEVSLLNLPEHRRAFQQSYPELEIPVIYAAQRFLPHLAAGFDAVIATANDSVAWLQALPEAQPQVRLGYYVQGYEPLMYIEGSSNYQTALQSYTFLPKLILFTKTDWTRRQVQDHTGAVCQLVGPSVDIDLYRPRPPIWPKQSNMPVRIAAMVRANSSYRSPRLTMETLQKASWRYGREVDIFLFGIEPHDPQFLRLPIEFAWRSTGLLSPWQVARLMNEIDIFVDFSQHQAMGLSALEAMACGAGVIVPQNGGAIEFVHDGQNGLVVDTSSAVACWQGLQRLIEDAPLLSRIRAQAIQDVCQFYPEQAAFYILKALFDA